MRISLPLTTPHAGEACAPWKVRSKMSSVVRARSLPVVLSSTISAGESYRVRLYFFFHGSTRILEPSSPNPLRVAQKGGKLGGRGDERGATPPQGFGVGFSETPQHASIVGPWGMSADQYLPAGNHWASHRGRVVQGGDPLDVGQLRAFLVGDPL